jgi:hypothetical protein
MNNRDLYKWVDTSSWSRSDPPEVRAVPKEWTMHFPTWRLIVHGHIHNPGAWYASAHGGFSLDRVELRRVRDGERAKAAALALVRKTLADLTADLEKVAP